MAHESTIRENSKAEFTFTGSRNDSWDRLGSELRERAHSSMSGRSWPRLGDI